MLDTRNMLPIPVSGDWQVTVDPGTVVIGDATVTIPAPVTLAVPPAVQITVTAERYEGLPLFNADAPGWVKGARLRGVETQETTNKDALDPASFTLSAAPGGGPTYTRDVDYAIDLEWGTFGRLPGGRIDEAMPVYASYRHGQGRLDAIIINRAGQVSLRTGIPHIGVPEPPTISAVEIAVAHVWVPARLAQLTANQLFPITETAYPEPPTPTPSVVEQYCPHTLHKLRNGEHVRILAWGDSVTDGSYLPSPDTERWQEQFVARLRAQFPQADIELIHLGWGGRNTESFLNEPPGSPYNYREQVLGARADLIVSEFVNDAGLSPEGVEERYSRFQADFQTIGAEWIILTPHYVRLDWMGLTSERDIDQDPRPYVAGLRQFADHHGVALADAALRWGRLWRQGIPYTTLFLNAINHPDARGMKLFADSLLALFPTA